MLRRRRRWKGSESTETSSETELDLDCKTGKTEYEKQRFLNRVGEENDLEFRDYEDVCFWGNYEFGLSVERCRCSLAEVEYIQSIALILM